MRLPTWICGGCRSCSAASGASRGAGRPLSRRLFAAGLGERDAIHAAGSGAGIGVRRRYERNKAAQSAASAFLNEVILRDLCLGESSVDLRLRRHDKGVSLEVLRTRGRIQVSIVMTR